jgi:hypothetical protein
MKIFLVCSRSLYGKVPPIQAELEKAGHVITLPNSYDNPGKEDELKATDAKEHSKWKASMIKLQAEKIAANDAILVLNFEKNGQPNYIGGATFLEMFKAWETGKKIFLYNDIPQGILRDEIAGMAPILINRDLNQVK